MLGTFFNNRQEVKMADYGKGKSLSRATSMKEEGNNYFKQGNLDTALKYFTQVSG